VVELFKHWDIDATKKLELSAFTSASMQVGPHESKLLARLADMDLDKDGFITDEEWLKWFTATAGMLNPEEFDMVMTEMTDAADNMVALIRCTRLAAEAAAETPAEVIESPRAVEEVPKLEGERLAKVEALFKEWDFESKGEIDRVKVSASAVKFGPHKSRLFHQLEQMDTDGDNIISLDEMKIFFQVVSPQLTDENFAAVIAEMEELAGEARVIAMAVAMAEEAPTELLEAAEPVVKPTLAPSRQELLGKLFGLFTEKSDDTIDVVNLEKCTIKEGPHEKKLLTDLKSMDANSDGKLSLDEMTDYFAVLGVGLSDEEFELIIGEMVDVCSTNQLAAQLAAFAAGV